MTPTGTVMERGSEWRQWDLHVHTPASFHWTGSRLDEDPRSPGNATIIDEMIRTINAAKPAVFAIMDYWTFDGWFALQHRLRQPGAPQLLKTVFPGIELRLAAPMQHRLNAHVIFSETVGDQILRDFLSHLMLEIVDRPLSRDALIHYARSVGADLVSKHGFKRAEVESDPIVALRAGSSIAELHVESYKRAIAQVPEALAVGLMPYDTSDGLSDVDWTKHYAYFISLFRSSPIFESRKPELRDAFLGQTTDTNAKWIGNFQAALNNIPRLVVSGSDAHQFVGATNNPDKRGYGDFPSGRITWIKADPTFLGLRQAILEPARRSYIGATPPKLATVNQRRSHFIDRLRVDKTGTSQSVRDPWLDGCELAFNVDLVAIIGNKGSGKSALADVLALLGNSSQRSHFSFLRKDRFRGKSGDPARQFEGTLTWRDGTSQQRNLNEDPPPESVERVRYVPQGHFEELCNDHVSRRSDAFERELRSVIFSHTAAGDRLDALDFEQLIDRGEAATRDALADRRKELQRLNEEISSFEEQLKPEAVAALNAELQHQLQLVQDHNANRPPEPLAPTVALTEEQVAIATSLDAVSATVAGIEQQLETAATEELQIGRIRRAISNITERMRLLERAHAQFLEAVADDLTTVGLAPSDLVALTVNSGNLDSLAQSSIRRAEELDQLRTGLQAQRHVLLSEREVLSAKLNEPQLVHQRSLKALADWKERLDELEGTPTTPASLCGIQTRISQVEALRPTLSARRQARSKLCGAIFTILESQRLARQQLFRPVQELIATNALIREDYRLQFVASLSGSLDEVAARLFSLVKQTSGDFRGEDESRATLGSLMDEHLDGTQDGAVAFADALLAKLTTSGRGEAADLGIRPLLRKDRTASEVYDLIFGLTYLEPRYSLLFQDTPIEQLSPGQRGALLLIFYLLVDKDRTPIVLDQPEENLDNATVVSLLVPVLSEAKRHRQIFMVTHNPNLAVVCDAEQVVFSRFERRDEARMLYTTGSIESTDINRTVVDVLEGTKPAFDNRRGKYH